MVLEPAGVLRGNRAGDTANPRGRTQLEKARGGMVSSQPTRHPRFWQCMDTARDVKVLEDLWQTGRPPWKVWR